MLICLDTETDFDQAPLTDDGPFSGSYGNEPFGQLAWFSDQLDAAAAKRQANEIDWIIVSGHRPMFGSYNKSINIAARDSFLPLMEKSGVDLYIASHWCVA